MSMVLVKKINFRAAGMRDQAYFAAFGIQVSILLCSTRIRVCIDSRSIVIVCVQEMYNVYSSVSRCFR